MPAGTTQAQALSPSGAQDGAPLGFGATVSALAVGQIVAWAALYYAFTTFVLPMQRALGWSQPVLMGAFTVGLALWGAATYAVGAAIDHGHGRAVMTWGAVLAGLGFLAWSRVTEPWMLYAVWAVLGTASAMTLYEPAFNVLTKRYPLRYQQGITALTLVAGFASTLSLPVCLALIRWLEWRNALAVIGAVLLLFVAPLHAWALRGPALVAAPHGHDERDDATLREALRQRAFWLLTLCFTLYAFDMAALWAHAMPALAEQGLSETQAMAILVWVGPAQVLGRVVYVVFGRRWSLRAMGGVVLLGLPVGLALLAWGHSTPVLLAFALLFGMGNGLVTIVRGGLVPQYFGRTHVGRIGGAMSGIGLLARATAPLLAAWLLLLVPGYRALNLLLALLGVVAVASFWGARPPGSSTP